MRALALCLLMAASAAAQIAVRGDLVYTMAGAPVANGVVLIRDGKIEGVGPAAQLSVPAGYRTLRAAVVTPGLVDAHTVVGLTGWLNQPHDQEQIERSAPLQPELRAIDAYNPKDELVKFVREMGVTTIHTGHGPGALISGQTMILKTVDAPVDQTVMVREAMVAATLGAGGKAEAGKSPGTTAKMVALLRAELIRAGEYAAKKEKPRDLRLDALARVLSREIPLMVSVHRSRDILTALRIAKEFNIRLVLDGVAEAYDVLEPIKAAGFPVIVHPTMARAAGEAENLSMETASKLRQAAVPFALQSGFESYVPKTRLVLFEAAAAAAHGLTKEQALAAITIDAARLLGVDKRVGSLEAGKDADLALYDGDPFEYVTHCTGVVIDGKVVSEGRH
ncbi:MAG: amidohydrolase family protein [Bryobacteraceae bacterium]|nr:amidohydrolase family protein [Bryobacteraceae bacterium]